jgi:hypothetical protein
VKQLRLEFCESLKCWVVKNGKWRFGHRVFRDKAKAEKFLKEITLKK